MVLPNLIHPINITIEQWSEPETIYDDDFREPIQQAARAETKVVKGQPNWDLQSSANTTKGGIESEAAGYVLFRYIDLNAAGVTLKQQDRITKMGHIDTDVYIIGLRPTGHYPDQDGAALVKAFFTDRAPSRGVVEHQ